MKHCKDCPINETEYCHKVNPMAKKKYTRSEKKILHDIINKGQSSFKESE